MTSGFSGNLALFNVEYCHVHCDCVEPNKFLLLLLLLLLLIPSIDDSFTEEMLSEICSHTTLRQFLEDR